MEVTELTGQGRSAFHQSYLTRFRIFRATKVLSFRALVYRLYIFCERKGWTEDARAYNELINAWNGIEVQAMRRGLSIRRAVLIFEDLSHASETTIR
jgi:hypothetical protein